MTCILTYFLFLLSFVFENSSKQLFSLSSTRRCFLTEWMNRVNDSMTQFNDSMIRSLRQSHALFLNESVVWMKLKSQISLYQKISRGGQYCTPLVWVLDLFLFFLVWLWLILLFWIALWSVSLIRSGLTYVQCLWISWSVWCGSCPLKVRWRCSASMSGSDGQWTGSLMRTGSWCFSARSKGCHSGWPSWPSWATLAIVCRCSHR